MESIEELEKVLKVLLKKKSWMNGEGLIELEIDIETIERQLSTLRQQELGL